MQEKGVVGVTGMPGAGKATFREIAEEMGYPVVVMGDVIRKEVERRKLKPTPENLGRVMLELRIEEGPTVVAKRCVSQIEKAEGKIIVVDGIRSIREIEEIKTYYPSLILIAIHASPKTRFQRLFQRKRNDDPKNWRTFVKRDLRELGVNVGSAIATADYMIVNEGTKDQMKKAARTILIEVLRTWMK